jgi:hypothetical protein
MNKSNRGAWKKPAAAAARRRRLAGKKAGCLPDGFDRERATQIILDRLKRYSDAAALEPPRDIVDATGAAQSTKAPDPDSK